MYVTHPPEPTVNLVFLIGVRIIVQSNQFIFRYIDSGIV